MDEFETIARLFAPLSAGAPGAFGLLDDAAIVGVPPGEELVVTTDAIVEGVHFLPGDPLDLVARKLLRVNLSDLAAKAAEPFAYLLTVAWSPRCGWTEREAFAAGLAQDQAEFGVTLIGGDTVSTPGPLTASVTAFGRVPAGRMVTRSGAKAGDFLVVGGDIGSGWLGLQAAVGELLLDDHAVAYFAERYRLPRPQIGLRKPLRRFCSAASDVSDGLLADAGRIAAASGLKVVVELDKLPMALPATWWVDSQPDVAVALSQLAVGGDDYAVAAAMTPEVFVEYCCWFSAEALAGRVAYDDIMTVVGRFDPGSGIEATYEGRSVPQMSAGWRHG